MAKLMKDELFEAQLLRAIGYAMGIPVNPRLAEAHRREVESFRRGAALLDVPPELSSTSPTAQLPLNAATTCWRSTVPAREA
jgi:hypothetical protein